MANHTPSSDKFARLHAAHTALQLKSLNYEPFHALAVQHLLSSLPTSATVLLPPNALASATASFVSAYGGPLWPSYAPYRTHLTHTSGSSKLKSKSLLSFSRDAMPKTKDLQKAREKGGEWGQAELVSKTKLGKLVGKYLAIVAEEVFARTHLSRIRFDDEIIGKLLQAVLGNADWSALRLEIKGLKSSAEGALRGSGPVAVDTVPSPGAPSERPSAEINPEIDALSPGVDADFGVEVGLEDGESLVVNLELEELSRSEENWKQWAQEMKRERKRADSVTRVEEWMEGLDGDGNSAEDEGGGGGVLGSAEVGEGAW